MKTILAPLMFGSVRLPRSDDGRVHAACALRALGLTSEAQLAGEVWLGAEASAEWAAFEKKHALSSVRADFGLGQEPSFSVAELVRLTMSAHTPQARRLQRRVADIFTRSLEGDVKLAADVAERSSDPAARAWLSARLESQEARRNLMRLAARCGGHGPLFGQLGSVSNQSVLGQNSASIRRERGVKHTRDGLSVGELRRLAYLDAATAAALERAEKSGRGDLGNEGILALHRKVAEQEKRTWSADLGRAS